MATILIIDDDRVVSQQVAGVLRAKGHKPLSAFDAVQGMMMAMKSPSIDAIVLDINMPGGSGEETMKKLKMRSGTAEIPIIILSGSIDSKGQQRVRDLGAVAVLSKPLVAAELLDALAAAIT